MGNDLFLTEMGVRIAHRRKQMRLTQEQLAEQMGVSLQTISCIELGKKAVRPANLAKLCVCLDITADYVLFGKRSSQQMNETLEKLSKLPPEEYRLVQELIELFSSRK